MPKISTFLWFNDQAEEAARLYTSLLPDSRITNVARDELGVGSTPGRALTVTFELAGQPFIALNGGPQFTPNEAFSIFVECADQAEVDRLWERLTADGGEESRCGWLKDKYGVSWQIVPRAFLEMMGSTDKAAAGRATNAMLGMNKLDVAKLQAAFEGR